jgi:hypothetical protein
MESKKPKQLDFDYWLARTALLWIEGELREAEEAWRQADSRAQKLPGCGAYEFDRHRCALLRTELDKAATEPAPNMDPIVASPGLSVPA